MKGIIDRFENKLAVVELENKSLININRSKIPKSAKEGDVILINKDNISLDLNETNNLKKEINDLMNELFID
ncbi:DUF3006 domain-containing protein [Tepidibacter hydrothermalis]|uniref:DUF3006 domain-containing protein n=1 Tax=Tepidibacter hydrothermalis TaxID=3036126 RepID=A0ABY8EI24_9FIRM|nr:DUF3006 domain-containing protein [Tepidibacter hydrothermalis]WFD11560.1 DUF3006 domain-containing protein [Tepidibacter hydrothermalis]